MTTKDLRERVIDKVSKVEDEALLNDIMNLIDDKADDRIYRLSDDHAAAIDTAINEIEKGDYLSNEQANKLIDEWLNQ
jgi:hypothetical protein